MDREGPEVELPQEEREVEVEVRARGYETWITRVSLAADARLPVDLHRSTDRPPRDAVAERDTGGGSIPAFGEGP